MTMHNNFFDLSLSHCLQINQYAYIMIGVQMHNIKIVPILLKPFCQ